MILIGGSSIVVGKIFGPLILKFLDAPNSLSKVDFQEKSLGFSVTDNEKVLLIQDNSGEEIFQIDKDA